MGIGIGGQGNPQWMSDPRGTARDVEIPPARQCITPPRPWAAAQALNRSTSSLSRVISA